MLGKWNNHRKIKGNPWENEGFSMGKCTRVHRHLRHLRQGDGRKTLEDSDLRFLDRWTPSPYFLVEANHAAKEEARRPARRKDRCFSGEIDGGLKVNN